MIPKAEREKDKAICQLAADPPWEISANGASRDTDETWVIAEFLVDAGNKPSIYLRAPCDSVDDTMPAANALAAAHCRDRLPAYIAEDEEMERRVAEIAALAETRVVAYSFTELNDAYNEGFRSALKILRGET